MNLWVSGGEDGSKYSLDATPPYSSLLSFFHRRFPSTFALQHTPSSRPTGATSSSASRNSNLPSSCLLSSSIVEHGSKRKHPIDCVPGTLACNFSLNELRKIYPPSLPKRFQTIKSSSFYLNTRYKIINIQRKHN